MPVHRYLEAYALELEAAARAAGRSGAGTAISERLAAGASWLRGTRAGEALGRWIRGGGKELAALPGLTITTDMLRTRNGVDKLSAGWRSFRQGIR